MKHFPYWHYRRWLPVRHPLVEDWAVPVLITLYLSIFWISLVWASASSERLWTGVAVSVVFVAMAFRGFWHTDWGAYVYSGAMACLCYLTLPLTEAGIIFIFFSIGFLAHTQRWGWSVVFLSTVTLIAAWQGYQLGFHGLFLIITVLLIVFGGTMDYLFHRYLEQQNALLRSQDDAEHMARTAERERIARDLHDLLGHTLSGIRVKAELAGRLMALEPQQAATQVAEIEQLARSSLQQVRAAVSGYHEGGIALEINAARNLLSSAGIQFRPLAGSEVPARLENTLASILREGVTNIVRHAHATEVSFALNETADRLTFTLTDNGEGMSGVPGNGMTGIRARARSEAGLARWYNNPG
ncbi:MAG: histidine kinase, partial [Natronospirillum sp.]